MTGSKLKNPPNKLHPLYSFGIGKRCVTYSWFILERLQQDHTGMLFP